MQLSKHFLRCCVHGTDRTAITFTNIDNSFLYVYFLREQQVHQESYKRQHVEDSSDVVPHPKVE